MTADTSNTWWLPSRRWWRYRKVWVTSKQRRCSAPELPPSTRCGTAARCPATWLRCWVSAVWVTSEFNSRTSSATRSRLSGAAPKTRARKETRSERVHRQQIDERSRGIAKTGRRTGNSGDSSKLESDVRADRRSGAERQAHGDRRATSDPIEVTPVQLIFGSRADSRLGRRNARRFRGHAALRRINRRAPDD